MNTTTVTQALMADKMTRTAMMPKMFHAHARWSTMVLASLILFSAMSLVYVKDLNRRLFISYQNLQAQNSEAYTQWGKLLLEQTTWSTQERVQRIAQKRLGMEVPNTSDIVIVKI